MEKENKQFFAINYVSREDLVGFLQEKAYDLTDEQMEEIAELVGDDMANDDEFVSAVDCALSKMKLKE